MLYNVTTMASTWHTIATADTRLLKHQMDIVTRLPKDYVFLNYLRCHDDIGWGLDYEWLKQFGIAEAPHKKYLNDYFRGYVEGSDARGELYNDDPVLQDARLCGTTASLCGLEAAGFEQNEEKTAQAIQRIEMLNAYLFIQSGIPVIYSGDEIGQVNVTPTRRARTTTADPTAVIFTAATSAGIWNRRRIKKERYRIGFLLR